MMTNASDSGSCLFQLEVAPTQAPVQLEHDPLASVPSLRHLPYSSSLVSLTRPEGDTPLFSPTLVQNPSVRVVDLPSQSDIIIA